MNSAMIKSSSIPNEKSILSGLTRELNAVLTIVARNVLLTLKSPGTLIMSLAMPIVMMGMIGGNLSQNMAGGLGFDYGQFMLVGMLVNMLFMVTSQGLSSLVEDRETNFTQEIMVAPVSRYSIVIGTILGSAFMAIVSRIGTLVVGLFMGIHLGAGQLLMMLVLSPLICLSAGAVGMLIIAHGNESCSTSTARRLPCATVAMRSFTPAPTLSAMGKWRAVYAERCTYGLGSRSSASALWAMRMHLLH